MHEIHVKLRHLGGFVTNDGNLLLVQVRWCEIMPQSCCFVLQKHVPTEGVANCIKVASVPGSRLTFIVLLYFGLLLDTACSITAHITSVSIQAAPRKLSRFHLCQ